MKTTEKFLENLVITMTQCKILLETCPQEANFADEIIEVPILTPKELQFNIRKNDAKWNHAFANLNDVLNTANKLSVLLEKISKRVPSVEQNLATPQFVCIQENCNIVGNLEDLSVKISELQRFFGNVVTLNWLEEKATFLKESFQRGPSQIDSNINLEMEKLIERILVVIQNIYKKYTATTEEQDNKQKTETEDEDAYVLNENHFKSMIIQNLCDDLNCLQFKEVFNLLHKTATAALAVNPAEIKAMLSQTVPLLEQLSLLYQYYITQQVSAYRITCKMTSILLNIFINLVSKVSD